MLNFKKISLSDKKLYEEFIKIYNFQICDYSFNALYAWQDYYQVEIAVYNKSLFIKVINTKNSNPLFYLPITSADINESLLVLEKYCMVNNYNLVFTCLLDFQIDILKSARPNMYIFENMRSNADYLYNTKDLQTLSGKNFKNKRNFINQFKNEYLSRYSYELITKDRTIELLSFLDIWYTQNDNESIVSFEAEKKAITLLLESQEELNITGGIIKIDGKIVAFCLGSVFNNMMITHFEKALYNVTGGYQMINYLFANNNCNVLYINREEDLGIEGIRKAKKSYNPCALLYNYNGYPKKDIVISTADNENINDIKELWYQGFNNDNFAFWFFNNIYKSECCLIAKIADNVIATAHVFKFLLSNGQEINYLYGLSTAISFRKQGIMRLLIESIRNTPLILIPENSGLLDFYDKLGFSKALIGYEKTYSLDNTYTNQLSVLTTEDIPLIDKLYKSIYPSSILRDTNYYKIVFNEFLENQGCIVGIKRNNELVAYAFVFIKQCYALELVSVDKDTSLCLISNIISSYSLNELTCINRFEGEKRYYCYKGVIPDDLYINLLFN